MHDKLTKNLYEVSCFRSPHSKTQSARTNVGVQWS